MCQQNYTPSVNKSHSVNAQFENLYLPDVVYGVEVFLLILYLLATVFQRYIYFTSLSQELRKILLLLCQKALGFTFVLSSAVLRLGRPCVGRPVKFVCFNLSMSVIIKEENVCPGNNALKLQCIAIVTFFYICLSCLQ